MSCNNVQILNYNHSVVLLSNGNTLVITDNNKCNSITIPQPVTKLLQINSPGPQGPAGTGANINTGSFVTTSSFNAYTGSSTSQFAGTSSYALTASYAMNAGDSNIDTGSFVTTSSFNSFTASYNTGSFTGSFIGSLQGTASWANNAISASYAATSSNILGGKATHVPFFNTDTTLATSSLYQSGSTSIIINLDVNTTANPEALFVWQPSQTSFNVISGKGNLDNYLQLNIQNNNNGPTASSDVVATANNGNESSNYIDMGINGENFQGDIGGPNDAYLYSAGNHLHVGTVTNYPIQFFAGGFDTDTNRKFELNPNNSHNMTGSLEIDTDLTVLGGITGSLFGTASWARNAITASYVAGANVNGTVTSASYAFNATNADNATYASIAGNGGVTQLVAGSGIILVPAGGTGVVTVASTGVGGVTIISGSNVTQSFNNATTWSFTHNLGTRVPVITVFDTSYNQIIPQNIELTNTASATITFPVAVSGFAVGSVGGTSATALSASYALQATYANTASYYAETDPVFVAKSASLATTGSNTFRGDQTITGSLTITGSNTLIGTKTITGSVFISGSKTIIGNNIITGSLSVSGSSNLIGNQILIGNKTITGSVFISGSKTIIGNNTVTGSMLTTGSIVLVGTQTITGSLTVSGSGTFTNIGPAVFTGSVNITGSNTLIGTKIITGSVFISGSKTVIGTNTITGSLLVSGSTTQTGNNILIGNTSLTGSFNISGSQTFIGTSTNIGTQIVTGSLLTSGSQILIGNTILSGSINISGSQTFNGTSAFYGNHTLSGSNTIVGNTVMSGSFEVSGSTMLHNSIFVVTGSTFINGTTQITGSTGITGSFSVRDGDINIVSGSSFTRWGNKLFNYGQFSDTSTQSGSANTAYAMKFNTTDFALNTRIVSESRITVDNTGVYNLQFSAQLTNTANTNITFDIWFAYTGSNIANTNTQVDVNKSAGQLGRSVAAWNLATPITAGDYVEIYWSCNAATGQIVAAPTQSAPSRPAIPSVIATLTQIA